ncbi:hypothetical protein D1115_03755 [Vibrio alfacsensis]|uniref:Uncharacterized protein n=1 Tax=Vibrio alfacsensis TaxID=1074311 RepID=A0ABN5PB01_9VIBR|nr:hypothetical protein D1115_03755 [Vibrio alfacsensis]
MTARAKITFRCGHTLEVDVHEVEMLERISPISKIWIKSTPTLLFFLTKNKNKTSQLKIKYKGIPHLLNIIMSGDFSETLTFEPLNHKID